MRDVLLYFLSFHAFLNSVVFFFEVGAVVFAKNFST